jgi:hypothetical protein
MSEVFEFDLLWMLIFKAISTTLGEALRVLLFESKTRRQVRRSALQVPAPE